MIRISAFSGAPARVALWSILLGLMGVLGAGLNSLTAQTSEDGYPPLTPELRSSVVEGIGQALTEIYIYEDIPREMAGLIQRKSQSGDYDEIRGQVEFARVLTEDLRSVANDLHLRVRVPQNHVGDPDAVEGEEEADAHGAVEVRSRSNFGLRRAEVMEGNVGYLEVNGFEGGPEAGATVIAAMNFLGNADALIIDLRKNGGGGASVIQMIYGYLLDAPTHITGFYTRETDTHQQFWSPPYVPGPSLADVPVFVLVSPRTFSAAEAFAFSMQTLGRGAIVGEGTPGGSHPVRPIPVSGTEFVVHVPFARTVDPRTDQDWEGTGIIPDIPTPAEEALYVAHFEALRAIRDQEEDPIRRRVVGTVMDRLQALRDAPTVGEAALASYVGRYTGDVEVEMALEESTLVMEIGGRRFSPLTFMGEDQFALEGSLGKVKFTRDGGSRVSGFEAFLGEGGSRVFRRVGG